MDPKQMSDAMEAAFIKQIEFETGADNGAALTSALSTHKVVQLCGVPAGTELFPLYQELVGSVGQLVRKGEDFEADRFSDDEWLDIRYDPGKADTYRHSNTAQPLHTDGSYIEFPYDLIFFFCIEQAEMGGSTNFIPPQLMIDYLRRYDPQLFEQVSSTDVRFSKGGFGNRTRKLIDKDEKGWLFNWNKYRVADDNPAEVREMCGKFDRFLHERIVLGGIGLPVLLQPGEAVFFHDRRLLHGRSSFLGNRHLVKGAIRFSANAD